MTPEYQIVGCSFAIGDRMVSLDMWGLVIASPQAIYLVSGIDPSKLRKFHFEGFFIAAVGEFLRIRHSRLAFNYDELPESTRDHPDWPLTDGVGWIFIKRRAVEHIEYNRWGTYDLYCGNQVYKLGLNMFRHARAFKYLHDTGWNALIDPSLTMPAWRQVSIILFLVVGFIGGGAIGLARGGNWLNGRGAAIEYAAIGSIIGLLVALPIYVLSWFQVRRARRLRNASRMIH